VKTDLSNSFPFNPLTAAIAMAMVAQFSANVAYANAGFGDSTNLSNQPIRVPTFNANSPVGPVVALDPLTGLPTPDTVTKQAIKASSGKALRKFVDTLPGIGPSNANKLGQYLPVAVPEKWVDLNGNTTIDDYMEIAAVEYTQKCTAIWLSRLVCAAMCKFPLPRTRANISL